jgi:hypothetical protein
MECICCLESCAAEFVTCRDCEKSCCASCFAAWVDVENTITCPHCKVLHEISVVSNVGIDEEMARRVSVDKLLMRISNDSPEKLERFKKYLDREVSRVPNKPVPKIASRFNNDTLDATVANLLEYLCVAQKQPGNKRTAFEMCQQEGVDSIDRAISIVNEFTDEIRARVANKNVISDRLLAFDDIFKYTTRISTTNQSERTHCIFARGGRKIHTGEKNGVSILIEAGISARISITSSKSRHFSLNVSRNPRAGPKLEFWLVRFVGYTSIIRLRIRPL